VETHLSTRNLPICKQYCQQIQCSVNQYIISLNSPRNSLSSLHHPMITNSACCAPSPAILLPTPWQDRSKGEIYVQAFSYVTLTQTRSPQGPIDERECSCECAESRSRPYSGFCYLSSKWLLLNKITPQSPFPLRSLWSGPLCCKCFLYIRHSDMWLESTLQGRISQQRFRFLCLFIYIYGHLNLLNSFIYS
jgi:hypothetical protein